MEIIVSIESCPAFKMSFLINCEISSKFEVNDSDYSRPVSLLFLWKGPDSCEITEIHALNQKVERIQTSGERKKKVLQKVEREISGTKMNLEG